VHPAPAFLFFSFFLMSLRGVSPTKQSPKNLEIALLSLAMTNYEQLTPLEMKDFRIVDEDD